MKKIVFSLLLLFYGGSILFDIVILKTDFINFFIPVNFQGIITILGFICSAFAFVILFKTLFLKNSNQRWLNVTYLTVTAAFLILLTVRFVMDLRNIFSVVFTSTNEAFRYIASAFLLPGGYTQSITFIIMMLLINIAKIKEYNHKT